MNKYKKQFWAIVLFFLLIFIVSCKDEGVSMVDYPSAPPIDIELISVDSYRISETLPSGLQIKFQAPPDTFVTIEVSGGKYFYSSSILKDQSLFASGNVDTAIVFLNNRRNPSSSISAGETLSQHGIPQPILLAVAPPPVLPPPPPPPPVIPRENPPRYYIRLKANNIDGVIFVANLPENPYDLGGFPPIEFHIPSPDAASE